MSRLAQLLAAAVLAAACGGTTAPAPVAPASTTTPAPTRSSSPTAEAGWATDLALIDRSVRELHPAPFFNHPEAEWTAKLAELAQTLPGASPDEQLVQVLSLIGLLDTHTWMDPAQPPHVYPVWLYRFPEGWFVVRATTAGLVGARLLSINGTPIDQIEGTLRNLVPFDNESGALIGVQNLLSWVEVLHGSGIVTDVTHPAYVFETPTGQELRPELQAGDRATFDDQNGIVGDLVGDAPEAVARRTERIWTRVDNADRVVLVSVNDYGDMAAATDEMTAALDSGAADRVVVDMRYLRGGSGDIKLVIALANDPRINRPGGLTVLIGRENESAATEVAHWLDVNTAATFVGEETPARADGNRCPCQEVVLPYSAYHVFIPTWSDHNGETRSSIAPNVPMTLSAAQFFAGRDAVLDTALTEPSLGQP